MQYGLKNVIGVPSGSRRTSITKKGSKTQELLIKQKGKCWKCHKPFYVRGLLPRIHHKDGNPRNHTIKNLALVCGSCHDYYSHKQTLKRPTRRTSGPFGLPRIRGI